MDDDDGPGGREPNLVLMRDVRIIYAKTLVPRNEWIGPLLLHEQPEPRIFDDFKPRDSTLTFQRSLRQFKGLHSRSNGSSAAQSTTNNDGSTATEEEPLDLESVMSAAGYDDSDSNQLAYDQAWEKRFASLRSVIGITGQCLVDYIPVRAGGESKRAKPLERTRAFVYGEWPVISRAVRYNIAALPYVGEQRTIAGAPMMYDAVRASCYILPCGRARATVREFMYMMHEGARLHPTPTNHLMRALFPTVHGLPVPANAERVVHRSLLGPNGEEEIDLVRPHENTFDIDELAALIDGVSRDISWLTLDTTKVFFQTITMFFYSRELERLANAYRTKNRWFDILARGRQFVRHVHALLCTEPQTLCFKARKYVEAVRRQRELKQRRRKLVGNRDTPRLAIAALDAECAAMRALITLPERSAPTYRETMAQNVALGYRSPLSEAEQIVVAVAVDIYALVLHDTAAREDLYANPTHAKRVRDSEHGATSGHMFTVFDSSPRSVAEDGDSAASLGAFTLDDWPLAEEQPPPPKLPRVSNVSLEPPPGTVIDTDVDASTLSVPTPLALPLAPVVSVPVVVSAQVRGRSGMELSDAISRLSMVCRPEQFVAGLRWLIDKSIIHRVPMEGSGTRNAGKKFDAFYLASIYSAQTRCIEALRDIYDRGVRESVRRAKIESAPGYDAAAAIEKHAQQLHVFREKCAFITRARQYARLVGIKHSEVLARSRDTPTEDAVTVDLLTSEAPEMPSAGAAAAEPAQSPLEKLLWAAESIKEKVTQFIAGHAEPAAADDPYAELIPVPPEGERQLTFGLIQSPLEPDSSEDEIEMCEEQQRAIDRSERSPISIITGRGGTGKTEVLRKIIARCAPEQVLVTAFTGKVVSELTRRVHKARTMHSLLVSDVLHRQEVRRVESILAALRGRARAAADPSNPLTQLTEVRAELYRMLGVAEHASPFENIRVLVIDEASLMPFEMFVQLLTAIHEHTKRTGKFLARLIICGDPWQLYPISYGAVLSDLCHAFPHCVHHMTINHRSDGQAIFRLANNIAKRRFGTPGCPWPVFGGPQNEHRLRTSTVCRLTGTETPAEEALIKRRADEASVVFMPATPQDLSSSVYRLLQLAGCFREPTTPEVIGLRESIIMIAPTRAVVSELNRTARSAFFGEAIAACDGAMQRSVTGEPMMPPAFEQRLMSGELCILRSNFSRIDYVNQGAAEARSLAAGVDAEMMTDAVLALIEVATQGGLQTGSTLQRVVTPFFNGELLRVVCFYDAPVRVTEATACRCGKHPVAAKGQPLVRSQCVLQPHEVPETRREPTDYSDPHAIKWHNQGMSFRNGQLEHNDRNKRRMAVFRVVNEPGRFKEIDVGARLANFSQFAFGEAATIHVIQGSESPWVVFVVDRDNPHFDWSMVYTACTRPRSRLIVLGDPSAFRSMVQRPPPKRRSDMFWLLATEVADVHAALDDPAADEWSVARAMGIDDELTMPLVSTRRRVADLTRGGVWSEYDRVKQAALDRGEE